jgi:hypothetical protein
MMFSELWIDLMDCGTDLKGQVEYAYFILQAHSLCLHDVTCGSIKWILLSIIPYGNKD